MDGDIRIFSIGDSALTLEFGSVVSPLLNQRAIALTRYVERHPFDGFIESVPAYASTTVFYDVTAVRHCYPKHDTAFSAVRSFLLHAISEIKEGTGEGARTVEVPVKFGGGEGPDLDLVARQHHFTPERVVEIFTTQTYRVYMLGFLPGFTYMGEVDEAIATERRDTPRVSVPAGSVGIAGRQTGIYSLESPGGWQLIGRTDVKPFTPHGDRLTLFDAGDSVRFIAIP